MRRYILASETESFQRVIKGARSAYFILSIFVLLSWLNPSRALALKYLDPAAGPVMVGAQGSTAPQNTFDLNQRPFVFLEFDRNSLETKLPLLVNWKWIYANDKTLSFDAKLFLDFPDDSLKIWKDANNWDAIKKPGEWEVKTSWFNPGFFDLKGGEGSKIINFTVTPEPVSCLLYLAGAAPIAFSLFRRRKNYAA